MRESVQVLQPPTQGAQHFGPFRDRNLHFVTCSENVVHRAVSTLINVMQQGIGLNSA